MNPWIAIESLVTREEMGGSDKSFGKGQAISVGEAIDLFTATVRRIKAKLRWNRKAESMQAARFRNPALIRHGETALPTRRPPQSRP